LGVNRRHTKIGAFLGLCIAIGAMAAAAMAAAEVRFQLLNNGVPMSNAEVVLYLSYGAENGRANANGDVAIAIEDGRGYWVEVNGARLKKFFTVDQTPAVIDVAVIGTMEWPGKE
jgi:hypothetical protein